LREPVWIHAVSVGETVAAVSFIQRWRERHPGLPIVFSTTTTTGYAVARKKLPSDIPLIYSPVDFWLSIRHALGLIRPSMVVIFEVEIWPNLILQSAGSGARVVLVNGRMSDSSSRSYARFGFIFGRLFRSFSAICVQTSEDSARIRRVVGDGVRVDVCNTMKFDQVPDTGSADLSALLRETFGCDAPVVWTAGSTHGGEEALIADVYGRLRDEHPALRLVLVPRHHERTPEVERALQARGLSYRLFVPRDDRVEPAPPVDVLIVNTTGELMNFYGASDIVYVGKSLAGNEGGHNIIEPAIFGKAIVHGMNMQNFRAVASIFQEHDAALEVSSDECLEPAVRSLLDSADRRADLGRRARSVVETYRGAVDRTLDRLEPLLGEGVGGEALRR
jgi:3-deoxy-D-manno-octulosonic-acid transferase